MKRTVQSHTLKMLKKLCRSLVYKILFSIASQPQMNKSCVNLLEGNKWTVSIFAATTTCLDPLIPKLVRSETLRKYNGKVKHEPQAAHRAGA